MKNLETPVKTGRVGRYGTTSHYTCTILHNKLTSAKTNIIGLKGEG